MRETLAANKGSPAVLVLAAGGSSRLGRAKQLLRYRLRPLLLRTIDQAARLTDSKPVVVLGADQLRLRSLLRRHGGEIEIAYNADWNAGLAGSIRAGLRCLPADCRGVLIMLSDQPLVRTSDLKRLVRRWQPRPATAAAAWYSDNPGAPAIIPRRFFSQLRGLSGDAGARKLLRELDEITLVEMPAAAVDIDTPTDAERLIDRA